MNRIEPVWELVQRDRLLRWSAIASMALVWLGIAWAEPFALLAAGLLLASVYVVHRRRGELPDGDDDVDLF